MPATRFCSACGEKIKGKQSLPLFSAPFCPACAPRFAHQRLTRLGLFILCLAITFVAGLLARSQRQITFIGTPVDSQSIRSYLDARQNRSDATGNKMTSAQPVKAEGEDVWTVCGAPTKAGHPCRRKVKGWGYCYQHRDKYGQKPLPPGMKPAPD